MGIRFSTAVLVMITLASSATADDTTRANRESEIEKLQLELTQLQRTFGNDHPKVVSIRKKIGLMQRLGTEFKQLPEHQAILDRLSPMLLEEQELIAKFGKEHPKVKSIRRRIEFTTKYLTDKLKRSGDAISRKTGKPDSVHDAFLKMLPLLIREQELIARYGERHSSVAGVRKQIAVARRNVVANSPTSRVPGRTGLVPESDHSPGVDDDADKPGRYFIETYRGKVILRDRETGRSWLMKSGVSGSEWIPIQHDRDIG